MSLSPRQLSFWPFKMIKISKNIVEVCRSIYLVQEVLAPCYYNTDARTRRRMHARTHAHAHHQLAATNAAAYQHPSLHVMPKTKTHVQIFEIIEMRASTVFLKHEDRGPTKHGHAHTVCAIAALLLSVAPRRYNVCHTAVATSQNSTLPTLLFNFCEGIWYRDPCMVQLSTALVGGVVMKCCRFAIVAAALCIVATSSTAMSAIVDRAPTDFPSNSYSTINDTAIVRPSMIDAAANGTGAHTRTHTQPTPDRLTQAARPKRVDVHAHQNGNYPVS